MALGCAERVVDTRFVRYTMVMVNRSGKATKKRNMHVDFEPNKMGLAIAMLAAVSLVLFSVITML